MDYKAKENAIKAYVESSFRSYLEAKDMDSIDEYIDDFIDLDKYKKSTLLFYEFSQYSFIHLSNMSKDATITAHIYFVLRNGSKNNLKDHLKEYATAFGDWFYGEECQSSFGGLIDYGIITDTDFYNAAEGNVNTKVCDISLQLNLED